MVFAYFYAMIGNSMMYIPVLLPFLCLNYFVRKSLKYVTVLFMFVEAIIVYVFFMIIKNVDAKKEIIFIYAIFCGIEVILQHKKLFLTEARKERI